MESCATVAPGDLRQNPIVAAWTRRQTDVTGTPNSLSATAGFPVCLMAEPPINAAALGARLRPFHAVLFGLDAGCAHTQEAKRAWGPALGRDIAYVPCDRSERDETLCARSGITRTPTLSFGGVSWPGFVPLAKVAELLDAADGVGAALKERRATLFTRDGCGWCDRQALLLGPLMAQVEVVNCSRADAARRCSAAGVVGVPAWRIGDDASGAPLVPGFRVLPELQALARADPDGLRRLAESASGGIAGVSKA